MATGQMRPAWEAGQGLRGAAGARASADRLAARLQRERDQAVETLREAEEALTLIVGDSDVAARVRCMLPALLALAAGRTPTWLQRLRRNCGLHADAPGRQLLTASAAELRAFQHGPRLGSSAAELHADGNPQLPNSCLGKVWTVCELDDLLTARAATVNHTAIHVSDETALDAKAPTYPDGWVAPGRWFGAWEPLEAAAPRPASSPTAGWRCTCGAVLLGGEVVQARHAPVLDQPTRSCETLRAASVLGETVRGRAEQDSSTLSFAVNAHIHAVEEHLLSWRSQARKGRPFIHKVSVLAHIQTVEEQMLSWNSQARRHKSFLNKRSKLESKRGIEGVAPPSNDISCQQQ